MKELKSARLKPQAMEAAVMDVVADILVVPPDEIARETILRGNSAISSEAFAEIILSVEDEVGITLGDNLVKNIFSIGDLVTSVEAEVGMFLSSK